MFDLRCQHGSGLQEGKGAAGGRYSGGPLGVRMVSRGGLMPFAEIVAEALATPELALTWKPESERPAVAAFTVDEITITIGFEQRETSGPWNVGFSVAGSPLISMAFRIFNGVFQAVREFIDVRQPEAIVFVAKDPDLAGVYETYLRRERSRLELLGYDLIGPKRVTPYSEWRLRRNRPSEWSRIY